MKGSPEALKPLLASVPANYDAAYANLAAEGIRVLALASKEVPAEALPTPATHSILTVLKAGETVDKLPKTL